MREECLRRERILSDPQNFPSPTESAISLVEEHEECKELPTSRLPVIRPQLCADDSPLSTIGWKIDFMYATELKKDRIAVGLFEAVTSQNGRSPE
jgi:hypothetical protein